MPQDKDGASSGRPMYDRVLYSRAEGLYTEMGRAATHPEDVQDGGK